MIVQMLYSSSKTFSIVIASAHLLFSPICQAQLDRYVIFNQTAFIMTQDSKIDIANKLIKSCQHHFLNDKIHKIFKHEYEFIKPLNFEKALTSLW